VKKSLKDRRKNLSPAEILEKVDEKRSKSRREKAQKREKK
jgi:hypothetical protein